VGQQLCVQPLGGVELNVTHHHHLASHSHFDFQIQHLEVPVLLLCGATLSVVCYSSWFNNSSSSSSSSSSVSVCVYASLFVIVEFVLVVRMVHILLSTG
jgi:hypothetical protein